MSRAMPASSPNQSRVRRRSAPSAAGRNMLRRHGGNGARCTGRSVVTTRPSVPNSAPGDARGPVRMLTHPQAPKDGRAMVQSADIVVVGGGLVGAACAYELARDGHRVVVIDRHDTGRATDAGAGILSPETMGGLPAPFLDLADQGGAHYRSLIPALAEAGGPDPSYAVCGALRIAFRDFDDEAF